MHTLSGRRFEIGTKYAPTVHDIAIGLSRIPRWAGATVRPWSVLHHSIAAGELVQREGKPLLFLAALTHDMEEMATGDIPKPYKTAQQSELGKRLHEWLFYETLKTKYPDGVTQEAVKVVDERLKLAELLTLCHPRSWWDPYFHDAVRYFVNTNDFESTMDTSETMESIDSIWELIDMPEREAIEIFTDTVESLLESRQIQTLRAQA